MHAALFDDSGVALGGRDAPAPAPPGPVVASRRNQWVAAVLAVVVLALILGVTKALTGMAPQPARVTAGAVSFVPAHGWVPAANPAAAPQASVTYGRDGATFSVWSQPGSDAEAAARQVAESFFPAQMQAGSYEISNDKAVKIRPRQSKGTPQLSMVQVERFAAGSRGAAESEVLGITVSAGPPLAHYSSDAYGELFGEAAGMTGSLKPGDAL